ncbi:DNA-processing protein DprA [Candidatus Saccharibacteria bacterium]|nr:DNA-processing protein DprA [Candidatus Saccharibacteria bacterium]MCB9834965.1 DNA-protecting protein DprA [Candidatus Nomurabacteria bacterium]
MIKRVTQAHSLYPEGFRRLYNPPEAIYLKGRLRQDIRLVAMIGTRKPSHYGVAVSVQIAQGLVRSGLGVVSGLAYGIDMISQKAALGLSGYTLAVLGSGLDQIYPSSNKGLAQRIFQEGGGLISEYPADEKALAWHFPMRNRLIAALAEVVIVIEAGVKSGTFLTVNAALDLGKTVYAVPGSINSKASEGTNTLIRQGATLIRSVDDVLEELGLSSGQPKLLIGQELDQLSQAILELVSSGVGDQDKIVKSLDLDPRDTAKLLVGLELKGLVRKTKTGIWSLQV